MSESLNEAYILTAFKDLQEELEKAAKKGPLDLQVSVKTTSGSDEYGCTLLALEDPIAGFALTITGDIIVSHDAWVRPDYRDKGLGVLLNSLRLNAFNRTDHRIILCTVSPGNGRQEHILERNGWFRLRAATFNDSSVWYVVNP